MNTPIDVSLAGRLARDALIRWGHDPDCEITVAACPGGWRFHAIADGTSPVVGGSDAVVEAGAGTVHRVPVGASDAAVARLLGI